MLSISREDSSGKEVADPESDRYLRSLEKALLDYLVYNSQNDPALLVSRKETINKDREVDNIRSEYGSVNRMRYLVEVLVLV